MSGCGLLIPQPLDHFLDGRLLAIHQDADAVDLGRNPDEKGGRGIEDDDGENFLPQRHAERHTHQHHDGRRQREERRPESQRAVGVFRAIDAGIKAEDENQHDGHHELRGVFLRVDGGAHGGEEGGIEQVAPHEVEHENNAHFEEVEVAKRLDGFGALRHLGHRRAGHGGLGRRGHAEHGSGDGQDGRQHATPDEQLQETDEGHADDLAHHELERLDGRNHQLHNAVRFLLHDAAHHHAAVAHDEHVDKEHEDHAGYHGDGVVRDELVALSVPLHGAHLEVRADVVDDAVEFGYLVADQLVLADLFAKHIVDNASEVGRNLLARVDRGRLGVFGQVVADFEDSLIVRIPSAHLGRDVEHGHELVRLVVCEQVEIIPRPVDDAHEFLVRVLDRGHPERHEDERGHQEWRQDGQDEERLLADAVHELAFDNDPSLTHGCRF